MATLLAGNRSEFRCFFSMAWYQTLNKMSASTADIPNKERRPAGTLFSCCLSLATYVQSAKNHTFKRIICVNL